MHDAIKLAGSVGLIGAAPRPRQFHHLFQKPTSSALATDLVYTTITGETWFVVKIAMHVDAGGTFIPRFAQSTHAVGTVTLSKGSYLLLEDSPN